MMIDIRAAPPRVWLVWEEDQGQYPDPTLLRAVCPTEEAANRWIKNHVTLRGYGVLEIEEWELEAP